jgi:hypothetical protein
MKYVYFYFFLMTYASIYSQIPGYVASNGIVGWWPFNGNADDESGNNNHGTVVNAVLTNDRFGANNSAYYFSSANCDTYIDAQINTAAVNGAVSITFWALREADGCTSPRIMKFDNNDGPGTIVFQWPNDNFGTPPTVGAVTSTSIIGFHPYQAVQDSVWVHFGLTLNAVECKLYQNGQHVLTVPAGGLVTLGGHANFGRMTNPAYDAFNGKLDDIGVWSRDLTQEEISSLYNNSGAGLTNEGSVDLKLFPNPTSHELNIVKNSLNMVGELSIHDQVGRLILTQRLESDSTTVELSSFPNGIYFLRVSGDSKVYSFVKQ